MQRRFRHEHCKEVGDDSTVTSAGDFSGAPLPVSRDGGDSCSSAAVGAACSLACSVLNASLWGSSCSRPYIALWQHTTVHEASVALIPCALHVCTF